MLETPSNPDTLTKDREGYNAENFYPDLEELQRAANAVAIPVNELEIEET